MKKKIKWLVKFLITVALFILIFNPGFFGIQSQFIPVTLESLWMEITGINLSVFWKWILAAMVIKALGMLSSMLRWDLLLKGQAIKLPFTHLVGTFLVGRFFGMFLPSTIGLDGYRLFDTAKHTGKVVESTTVILIEKLIGFVALTFLVFITLPLGLRFLPVKPLVLAVILLMLAGFIVFSFLLLFNPRIIQILIAVFPVPGRKKIENKLDKIAAAVSAYSGQKALLAKALVLGFCVHFCTALMYFATAMSIKTANIHVFDILFASPLMIYGTVLGPSIGGEGIREIVFALILGAKVGAAKAILFAHLGFWVGEILSLAGGIIYMIRPAEYRPKSEEIQDVLQSSREKASQTMVTTDVIQRVKSNIQGSLRNSMLAGIWAGFAVGLCEGLIIIFSFTGLPEQTVLFWSPLAYGILGGLLGCGFGLVCACLALFSQKVFSADRLWSVGFIAVFTPLALIIARFRIVRDMLHERPLTLGENVGMLVCCVIVAAVLYLIVRNLLRINVFRFLLRSYGAPIFCVIFIALSFAFTAFNYYYYERDASSIDKPSPFTPAPNVIFIMADALRADHLPAYGYKKIKTPNIDSLAGDSVLFTRNFAQSSWTKPQSATLLTSLYPSAHNTYLKSHVLPDDIDTLAEVMKKMGYRTGAVVSNINLSPIFNFQQGFDYYSYLAPDYFFYAEESSSKLCLYNLLRLVRERFVSRKKYVNHYYQNAETVNSKALPWLDRVQDYPFFLFIHYMDPHDPYFAHPYDGTAVARVSRPNPPGETAPRMRELYNQEIVYMDHYIGELIRFLKDRNLYNECLILFTADHGEEFFDHGGWWHGTTLFEEQIHVPLIIKLPKGKDGGTSDSRLVRSLDAAPTIIEAAGGTVPAAMQGKNVFSSGDPPEGPVFSEEDHEHNVIESLRTDRWKLIVTQEGSPRMIEPVMLFDIMQDPGETKNVAAQYPAEAARLRKEIEAVAASIKKTAYAAQEGEMDEATRQRLKALGYVE